MKRICFLLCVIFCFLVSCQNQAETVQSGTAGTQNNATVPGGKTTPGTHPEEVFDPSSITQEERATTMVEIQQLIQRLNGIIRAKNYNTWVSYLSPDYFAVISSAEYLERISQSAVLVKQNIVLKSAQDYFNHVVVPSRTNDRVDDIEFESHTRVKAYTINNKGERLRLYDLEKIGNEWKIVN
ncbi:MAG: hypothetical protein FWG07_11820 [Treponema sp.]|nr:hypothetical protein [Treponema sp.]